MSFAKFLAKIPWVKPSTLLELFPPFFFMGVTIRETTPDARRLIAVLPLRWHTSNLHGTMFGGFMCAVSDPLPALMCTRIFPGVEVWTKAHSIRFRRPGRSRLELRIAIEDVDVELIRADLAKLGESSHTFRYSFFDDRDKVVANVKNTVFLRLRKPAAV